MWQVYLFFLLSDIRLRQESFSTFESCATHPVASVVTTTYALQLAMRLIPIAAAVFSTLARIAMASESCASPLMRAAASVLAVGEGGEEPELLARLGGPAGLQQAYM